MIKEKNNDLKNMLIGVGVIFLYFIFSGYVYEFIRIFGINYNDLSTTNKYIYLALYQLLMLFVITFIYRKDFISNFKDFKSNIGSYIKKYIKYWIIALILMIISNIVISNFTTTFTSENNKAIINELKVAPLYILITTVFILPILEELVFRLSLRKIFTRTNILYIVLSGIFFGFIHVIGYLENMSDLLFIIPYSIPGFIFAYTHTKSNNIFVPISLHLIHNLVMIIILILI